MYIVDIHVYSNVFVYYTYWQKRCIYICSLHRLHQHVEIVLYLFFFHCSFIVHLKSVKHYPLMSQFCLR